MRAIDCPLDCGWLGGLAVVRDPSRAPAPTREACSRALDKLFAYSNTPKCAPIVREALDRMCVTRGVEVESNEWAVPAVIAFVCFGHRSANGQRLIDQFITASARDLAPEETAALLAYQRAWAGLFEVVNVHVGAGIDLRDLVSGEPSM